MEKSKLMSIIIIVLLVVLIGIVGVISFKAFSLLNQGEDAAAETETTQQASYVPIANIETVALTSPISTNLKTGPSGIEYSIRLSIAIGVDNTDPKASAELIAMLSAKEPIVRDICLSVITNMTYEELKAGDTQAILSNAILQRLQEEFETTLIYEVYVSDIYYQ